MKKFLLLVVCLLGLSIVLLINAAIAYDITEVRKDAEGGVAAAQALLGYLYYTGDSVEQDYQQAAEWYRKAAEQGNSHAQAFLGSMYLVGEGVEEDYLQAAAWLRKAAEQGNVFAQCRLGTMYYTGDGVGQDYFQAATWLRKAAEQGDSDAQGLLGILYYGGDGVEQDTQQAVEWLRKSAGQGNEEAVKILQELGVDAGKEPQNTHITGTKDDIAQSSNSHQASIVTDYEVARIDGRPLMRFELEHRLQMIIENSEQDTLISADMPTLYQSALNQCILDFQLTKEIDTRGIRVSETEADQAMKEYADQYFPTRDAFYQTLAMSGIKVDDYRKDVARQMAIQDLYRAEIGEVVVNENEAVDFYESNKRLFYMEHPEGFDVYVASYSASGDAQALYNRLTGGESWTEAISTDKLASHNMVNVTQEPIFLPTAALEAEIFAPLASLDVGEVSPVFSVSSNDFTVALKVRAVSESIRPYNDVSGDIRVMLREHEAQHRLSDFQRSLVEKAEIEIFDPTLFFSNSQEVNKSVIAEENVNAKTESNTNKVPFSELQAGISAADNINSMQLEKLISEGKVPLYVKDKGTFFYNPLMEKVQIVKDGVNLRSQPNPQANVIGKANKEMWGEIDYLGEWTHPKGDKWVVGLYDILYSIKIF